MVEILHIEKGIKKQLQKRQQWGKSIEFLLSCIAMSVGLGNIWRFPFVAYENGGGAFLIPYAIVLFLVGKPIYLMEMVLGQFSSRGCVKVYDFLPALRGVGAGQTFAVFMATTYYSSIMAIILYYFFASFFPILPWSVCDDSWKDCFTSLTAYNSSFLPEGNKSSSELYYLNVVMPQLSNIHDGIGFPGWKLTLCLLVAWITVFFVLWRGIKSTGKAAYFLAIFPYIMLSVLLVKALTLPGAWEGIRFFIKPDFGALLQLKVWNAAISQCFFSLSVGFGVIITYSSYNEFKHNLYRDTLIVTTIDMFTSFIAGFIIFGILGYLSIESGVDMKDVIKSSWNLAFMSYPEAISKFPSVISNVFAVMFFLMMYILAIGSITGNVMCSVTVITDKFPSIKQWYAVSAICIIGFFISLIYITPGGMFILNLVDTHGATFIVIILGIGQIIGVTWIYGIKRFCDDIEFMLNLNVGIYWRLCWSIITPGILIVILIHSLTIHEPLSYNNVSYPTIAIVCGWLLSGFGILLVPIFGLGAFYKRRKLGFYDMFKSASSPTDSWGPTDLKIKKDWLEYIKNKNMSKTHKETIIRKIYNKVLGY